MATVRVINLGLRFILELCMLAALAYWGVKVGDGALQQILLGVGAPALAAVFWGLFLSPNARIAPGPAVRLLLEIVVFALAIVALYATGQHILAVIFAIVVVVNRSLLAWLQRPSGSVERDRSPVRSE